MFFNFLNFFAIFLEFSIPDRLGTDRNNNFFSLSFSASPDQFWLEMMTLGCFLIFRIFLEFFFNSLFRVR